MFTTISCSQIQQKGETKARFLKREKSVTEKTTVQRFVSSQRMFLIAIFCHPSLENKMQTEPEQQGRFPLTPVPKDCHGRRLCQAPAVKSSRCLSEGLKGHR